MILLLNGNIIRPVEIVSFTEEAPFIYTFRCADGEVIDLPWQLLMQFRRYGSKKATGVFYEPITLVE